jgi:hypothetical protein
MSTIGRVIYGIPALQALHCANMNNASGVIKDATKHSKILWAKLAKNVSPKNQHEIQTQEQNSAQVTQGLINAKKLENEFFQF